MSKQYNYWHSPEVTYITYKDTPRDKAIFASMVLTAMGMFTDENSLNSKELKWFKKRKNKYLRRYKLYAKRQKGCVTKPPTNWKHKEEQ